MDYTSPKEASLKVIKRPKNTIAAGRRHTVGLKSDGTVTAVGDNKYGQCDVGCWRDIVAVAAGNVHMAINTGNAHTVGVSCEKIVEQVVELARKFNKKIITGYKDESNKDKALIVDQSGEIILKRAKSRMNNKLLTPSVVEINGIKIGYLLCVELLQGLKYLQVEANQIDIIFHSIGVGMFSDEQFELWIGEARKIALKYNSIVIGTSHADGSYKNCGVSIPISYCIDSNGESIFVSREDVRSRIVDLNLKSVTTLNKRSLR